MPVLFNWLELACYMILLKPHDDEILAGHVGRMVIANNLKSSVELHAKLIGLAWADKGASISEVLSKLLGVPFSSYLEKHTLLPFTRVVFKDEVEEDLANIARRGCRVSEKFIKGIGYLCSNCVEEDLSKHGCSYWKRSHQLPGVDFCMLHSVSLTVIKNKDVFLFSPNHWSSKCVADDIKFNVSNSFINNYYEISSYFLSSGERVPLTQASNKIRMLAKELGLGGFKKSKEMNLSAEVAHHAPTHWLENYFSELLHDEYICKKNYIDSVLRGNWASGMVYAMILSALFDSGHEAIDYFFIDLQ